MAEIDTRTPNERIADLERRVETLEAQLAALAERQGIDQ